MSHRIVLLDLGGVLIDFGHGGGVPTGKLDWRGREALLHYLHDRGRKITSRQLDRTLFDPWHRGHRREQALGREERWGPHLRRLRKLAGVRTHTATLLGIWVRPFFDQLRPMRGVEQALREIRRRVDTIALISNAPLPGLVYRKLMRARGLEQYIDLLYFSYDRGSRKPSPAMLRAALAEIGVRPQEAIMVGDRKDVDVAAGIAAGTATVWLRSEHRDGPRPDHVISSLGDLVGVL